LNLRVRGVEVPLGLVAIFLILVVTALLNLFTKVVATAGGVVFTTVFLSLFLISEHYNHRRRRGARHEHLEQFNQQTADQITDESLGLHRPFRKLVAIRSPHNLVMLERALAEADPDTTDVVVVTAKHVPPGVVPPPSPSLGTYDRQLMTAVLDRAERAGKEVKPVIVRTNNPLYAVLKTARDLRANELLLGASNKYSADEQLEQIAFYWFSLRDHEARPLTVRVLGRGRDVYFDLNGGSRIPRIGERRARSVAELRTAGVGVGRVLLLHGGTQASRDLFGAVLTMLDPQVQLALVPVGADGAAPSPRPEGPLPEQEQARRLGRDLQVLSAPEDLGEGLVRLARDGRYDLVILPVPPELPADAPLPEASWQGYLVRHAPCQVLLAVAPMAPQDVGD
jgi:hypothetical protein